MNFIIRTFLVIERGTMALRISFKSLYEIKTSLVNFAVAATEQDSGRAEELWKKDADTRTPTTA